MGNNRMYHSDKSRIASNLSDEMMKSWEGARRVWQLRLNNPAALWMTTALIHSVPCWYWAWTKKHRCSHLKCSLSDLMQMSLDRYVFCIRYCSISSEISLPQIDVILKLHIPPNLSNESTPSGSCWQRHTKTTPLLGGHNTLYPNQFLHKVLSSFAWYKYSSTILTAQSLLH